MLTYADVRSKVDHQEHQVRSLIHVVKEQDARIVTNTEDIDFLMKYVEETRTLDLLESEWWRLEGPIWDISLVSAGLMSHRLHPAVTRITNLKTAWRKYGENLAKLGLRAPSTDWQMLLQMPVSFWASGTRFSVAVHVPIMKTNSQHYELWRWLEHPGLFGKELVSIHPREKLVATKNLEVQAVSSESLEKAYRLGKRWFLTEEFSLSSSVSRTCIAALWTSEWTMARELCEITRRPATEEMAWPLPNNTFNLLLPKTTKLSLLCQGKIQKTWRARGQAKYSVPSGCTLRTEALVLESRFPLKPFRVEIKKLNVSSFLDSGPVHLARPERTPYRMHAALEELQEGMTPIRSTSFTSAGLAGAALLVVCTFVVYLFCKARSVWRASTTMKPSSGGGEGIRA